MTLQINGEARAVPAGLALPQLVAHLGLPERGLLIEHNGKALQPREWPACHPAEGDRLEIIRIVAGG